jgi:hypothetical protein
MVKGAPLDLVQPAARQNPVSGSNRRHDISFFDLLMFKKMPPVRTSPTLALAHKHMHTLTRAAAKQKRNMASERGGLGLFKQGQHHCPCLLPSSFFSRAIRLINQFIKRNKREREG